MNTVSRFALPTLSLLIIFAAALYSLSASTYDSALAPFRGEQVVIQGVVVRDTDVRETHARIIIQPSTVNGEPVSRARRIMVSTTRFTGVSYDDTVHVTGTLKEPEVFETDSGRTFNYPRYLWAHGVSYTIPFSSVSRIDKGSVSIVSALLSIKHTLIRGIERALPEPHAALAEGLLLGEKRSLGDILYNAFVASGLVHIIVLSGYNVALVINAVLFITLRTLPRVAGYVVAAAFVVGFAILTGGSETTVRATIMALFMMMARVLRRPAIALRGLLIAAAAMASWNPFLVLYDLSFQLSVLATLGLILLTEPLVKRLTFVPEKFGIREIVGTTLATQIFVLPLLILSVGAVSLVFLPANILVLPLVPLAMLLSFIAAIVALISVSAAFPFTVLAHVVLNYIMSVSEFFGTFPFALVTVPSDVTHATLGVLLFGYGFVALHFFMRRGVQQ